MSFTPSILYHHQPTRAAVNQLQSNTTDSHKESDLARTANELLSSTVDDPSLVNTEFMDYVRELGAQEEKTSLTPTQQAQSVVTGEL